MQKRHRARPLIGTSFTLLLAACSSSAPPTESSVNPYANGASHPWSYAAPVDTQNTLSLTPGVNTLSYELLLAASNAWGPIEVDRSNGEQEAGDGKPLTLDGVVYKRGFGAHAGSEMRYSLQGTGATCTTFTANVGIDDEVANRGSVNFQVFLDGVKKYDSGEMTGASASKKANVNLMGARELRLVVTDAGNGIDFDHADWADPKITCVAAGVAGSPTVQFAQPEYTIFHKHNASLPVTFKNISGPVSLRLEMGAIEDVKSSGLVLETTSLTLNGSEETRDLLISAPTRGNISPTLGSRTIVAPYELIVSQNGQDIAHSTVTLGEAALSVSAAFEPSTVVSNANGIGTTTLVLKVSPPLDQLVDISASTATYNGGVNYLEAVGPTYGDGGTMRQDFRVNFAVFPQDGRSRSVTAVVNAGGPDPEAAFAGYRLASYGTRFAFLDLVRPIP
ncbi:NPCBM/NEW2 domain-containing protein [Deinococcus sp. SM5_A1]|uniref:NPCBM/NEW2 domain-containing protein n=1 Tax=Deinococcus sp. SM5_A1 TaxID=3379094 RepID=UPI00385EB083